MRILILNWKHPADPAAGGAERYVARVAVNWARLGHAITLFVPRPGPGGDPRATPMAGVRVVTRGTRSTVFGHARRYLRRRGSDFDRVLESVSTRPFFAHELVGDRSLVLYYQLAGEVWGQEFRFPLSWLGRRVVEPHWLRRLAPARVVTISASTAADLRARGIVPVAIVPPGVDEVAGAWDGEIGTSPRIAFVGRLVRTKRPLDALSAFATVRSAFPLATLDVIGDGYLHRRLRALRAPGVTVHGFVPEAAKVELLRRAHLLLLPGTREGWGIVAMEAAMCGRPTVGYDIPGVRDAVQDGVTGVLTEPGPRQLGNAAAALLADPARWRQLARAAAGRAREFTWDHSAERLLTLLTAAPAPPSHCSPAA